MSSLAMLSQGILTRAPFVHGFVEIAFRDSEFTLAEDPSHMSTSTGNNKPRNLPGQAAVRTPCSSMGKGQAVGVHRLRAHRFREATAFRGASLRMTDGRWRRD